MIAAIIGSLISAAGVSLAEGPDTSSASFDIVSFIINLSVQKAAMRCMPLSRFLYQGLQKIWQEHAFELNMLRLLQSHECLLKCIAVHQETFTV
jgi:hypothetical protein